MPARVLAAEASQPHWLPILVALIAALAAIGGPVLVEVLRRRRPPEQPIDAALALARDAIDDLQERLTKAETEREALRARLDREEDPR